MLSRTPRRPVRRRSLGALCALTALAAVIPCGAAAPALAAAPVPFTITEDVLAGTFTTTGPLCASGSFVDDVAFHGQPGRTGQANIVTHTVYACDDASGTFDALKVQHVTFLETSLSATGRIRLQGGTGDWVNLKAAGTNDGFIDFDAELSAGNIAGLITSL